MPVDAVIALQNASGGDIAVSRAAIKLCSESGSVIGVVVIRPPFCSSTIKRQCLLSANVIEGKVFVFKGSNMMVQVYQLKWVPLRNSGESHIMNPHDKMLLYFVLQFSNITFCTVHLCCCNCAHVLIEGFLLFFPLRNSQWVSEHQFLQCSK